MASAWPSRIRSWRVSSAAIPARTPLLGLLGHALETPQSAGLGCPPEIVEGLDAQLLVQLPDGPWPDAGDLEQRHEARRHLLAELLVEREAPGPGQLLDLPGDRLAHAGDARRLAVEVRAGDVDRRVGDRVGGLVVGDGLVDELALDLEHVADLVEDAGQLAVGEDRRRLGFGHGGMLAAPAPDLCGGMPVVAPGDARRRRPRRGPAARRRTAAGEMRAGGDPAAGRDAGPARRSRRRAETRGLRGVRAGGEFPCTTTRRVMERGRGFSVPAGRRRSHGSAPRRPRAVFAHELGQFAAA